jgi:hypothetical protein
MRRTAMVRVELIKPRTHVRGSHSVGERMAMADLFCRPGFPAHLNFSCSDVTRREHPCATVIFRPGLTDPPEDSKARFGIRGTSIFRGESRRALRRTTPSAIQLTICPSARSRDVREQGPGVEIEPCSLANQRTCADRLLDSSIHIRWNRARREVFFVPPAARSRRTGPRPRGSRSDAAAGLRGASGGARSRSGRDRAPVGQLAVSSEPAEVARAAAPPDASRPAPRVHRP